MNMKCSQEDTNKFVNAKRQSYKDPIYKNARIIAMQPNSLN